MCRQIVMAFPAVTALVIQCSAFAITLAVVAAAWRAQLTLPLLAAAFFQGTLAAIAARWRGMARWWPPIQFAFPVAVIVTHALQPPTEFFLAAFLASAAIFWTTFRTQVPYYPSGRQAQRAVAELLPANQSLHFIDIGSGTGELAIQLSRMRPAYSFTGIELAPLPWLVSTLRALATQSKVQFLRGDYNKLHLSHYDVVFAYLSPAAMPALWEKARREMKSESLLLSYEFLIPGVSPDVIGMPDKQGRRLYGWKM